MLIGRKPVVLGGKCRDNLVVFADDKSYAFDKIMVDRVALYIHLAGLYGVSLPNCRSVAIFLSKSGRYRKLSGAEIGVSRKPVSGAQCCPPIHQ